MHLQLSKRISWQQIPNISEEGLNQLAPFPLNTTLWGSAASSSGGVRGGRKCILTHLRFSKCISSIRHQNKNSPSLLFLLPPTASCFHLSMECTHVEILREYVPRQPIEPYWILRSWVKGQCYMVFCAFFVWMRLRLPADSTELRARLDDLLKHKTSLLYNIQNTVRRCEILKFCAADLI